MFAHARLALVLVAAGLMVGCQFSAPDAKATAKRGETSSLVSAMGDADRATTKADEATAAVTEKTAARDSGLLADINAASGANQDNPDGPPKSKVESHLEVAKARLDGVQEDPAARAAAAERDLLIESGKTAEARAATSRAIEEARAKSSELAIAKASEAAAISERDAARAAERRALATLEATLERNRQANAAAIDSAIAKARDEERKTFTRRLGFVLLGLAVAGALVAGATMYLSKGMEWERAAIAAGASAACFSLYWAMGQVWFKWLVWATAAGGVGAVAWFLWRESRQTEQIIKKKVRAEEADEAEDTLKRIIVAIDELGEGATVAEIRAKISRTMNDNHKALVHELRAESKRTSSE